MSRHTHPNKTKNKHEIEHLQEVKSANEEAKAELLEHNAMLKLHHDTHDMSMSDNNAIRGAVDVLQQTGSMVPQSDMTASSTQSVQPDFSGYTKSSVDKERIAANSEKIEKTLTSERIQQNSTTAGNTMQTCINQFFDLQVQLMTTAMQSWMQIFSIWSGRNIYK